MFRTLTAMLAALLGGITLLCALQAHAQPRANSGQRLALVIGNDTYAAIPKLSNARADARAMAGALQQVGFDVTLRTDLTHRDMLAAVRTFKSRLSGGAEAVFFFAGHGVQLGAANYLLPVDVTAANEEQIRDDAVALQRVLEDMTEQKVRFSLAIIDACRNNPFPRVAGRSIGGSRGLAPTTAATGQMVLYSAGAGQEALDKLDSNDKDPNGLFTRVFLQEMQRPGVEVGQMLRNVRNQVVALAKKVGHEQVPALYDQAVGEFMFRPGSGGAQVAVAPPSTPAVDPMTVELAFWDSIKASTNPNDYKAYLEQYPNGQFAVLARSRAQSSTPVRANSDKPVAAEKRAGLAIVIEKDAPNYFAAISTPHAECNSRNVNIGGILESKLLPMLRERAASASVFSSIDHARSTAAEKIIVVSWSGISADMETRSKGTIAFEIRLSVSEGEIRNQLSVYPQKYEFQWQWGAFSNMGCADFRRDSTKAAEEKIVEAAARAIDTVARDSLVRR